MKHIMGTKLSLCVFFRRQVCRASSLLLLFQALLYSSGSRSIFFSADTFSMLSETFINEAVSLLSLAPIIGGVTLEKPSLCSLLLSEDSRIRETWIQILVLPYQPCELLNLSEGRQFFHIENKK